VRERSLASFARLITDVSKVARPDCIAAGVTGLGAGTPPAMTYAGVLSEGLGTPPVAIAIGDDMWIAYRALFAPGEGGLVYAGTGSVGYAIGKDGLALKVGGYGILIDDAGSGFWIAREAIRRILRARDEDPVAQSVLADLLYERVGGSGWPIIREAVYGSDRGAIAALAPVVARASDAGDATAVAILSEAGVELARIGAVLARRGGFSQLALMGGAVGLHPVIFERFLATLPPGMTGRMAQANVADMAARLALAGAVPPANS
jgi:N-acetylglucosamine kinase-like BadF-type ATPase